MGKLEHGHNDKLLEGWERESQCDKTILKMGEVLEVMFLFVRPYSENKRVGAA